MDNILPLNRVGIADINQVGGKNASLGEMLQHLSKVGVKVPEGFATTAQAYQKFMTQNNLDKQIYSILEKLNPNNLAGLKKTSKQIRKLILKTSFPVSFQQDVRKAFTDFFKNSTISLAVRSSATAEDLPEASFAGQQETFLNVQGIENVFKTIKQVYASLFTERAIAYRAHQKVDHNKIAISVGVQRMVRSDKACSGVMFTLDTESGFDKVILITGNYGLGETVVQGTVNPDEFYVFKPMLQQNKGAVIQRCLGSKLSKMIYAAKGSKKFVKTIKVPEKEQSQFCLTDQEILQLAQYAQLIENHYQKPMDIEWAKDGITNELYIVQARPETVISRAENQFIERFHLLEKGKIKTSGRSVGQKIGQGVARIIKNPGQMQKIKPGDILVTEMTDPDWEPIMKIASAIVTNRGGRTCHAAIVARELGIPAVVGCGNATKVIKDGEAVTVSCAQGDIGHVYDGIIKFRTEKIAVQEMPALPFKLCMNLGNPTKAFDYQFLPNEGVGLARLEFIIGNTIGIHPQALLQFEKLPKNLKKKIAPKIAAYASPVEFYIQKLAEGIATIAAAFYPKEVIFRFSDFKSNEYANLLGGEHFEPQEENPMIGYRGASRYIAENFRPCFALECEAFKRVREQIGLVNAQVMVPFTRTVEELKQVVALMDKFNLPRGKNGLKLYMMCEIPSNALLADEFLQYCDGFSIGSNDLTQLTLGLDRDSALVAQIFDERNDAVKQLLQLAISACNKANKYVGICGQGPSDHPDLAKWLMEQGIQSMSLSPDTIVETWLFLSRK